MQEEILFPYDSVRDEQRKLISDVLQAVSSGTNLLAHAPTGLGKTIATLGPSLKYAIEHNKTVIFLTSRHTQHIMAVKTLLDIQERFGTAFHCANIIGKKLMCLQKGAERLPMGEFAQYCKALRQDDLCQFYSQTKMKGKNSPATENLIF